MNTGNAVKLKRLARLIGRLCAIELFLPGGTLIVLGYLLAIQCRVHRSPEGEPALPAWLGLRGLLSAKPPGGLSRVDANSAGPGTANRRVATDGLPVAGER